IPSGRSEKAVSIRDAGLVAMDNLDPALAGFHAARLLVGHPHTSCLSGEPSKTAVTVPPAVIAAVPAEPAQCSFVASYLGQGGFAEDLAALRHMLHWASLRGATQVRLVVKEM
ncbi:MAG: hypothetical protein AB4911_11500, partial [Oscillochloridaceae bacterium umkhey_bin13]